MCDLETTRGHGPRWGAATQEKDCFNVLRLKVITLYLINTLLYPTKATETENEPCGKEYCVGAEYYREVHGTNFLRRNVNSELQITKLQMYFCLTSKIVQLTQ